MDRCGVMHGTSGADTGGRHDVGSGCAMHREAIRNRRSRWSGAPVDRASSVCVPLCMILSGPFTLMTERGRSTDGRTGIFLPLDCWRVEIDTHEVGHLYPFFGLLACWLSGANRPLCLARRTGSLPQD